MATSSTPSTSTSPTKKAPSSKSDGKTPARASQTATTHSMMPGTDPNFSNTLEPRAPGETYPNPNPTQMFGSQSRGPAARPDIAKLKLEKTLQSMYQNLNKPNPNNISRGITSASSMAKKAIGPKIDLAGVLAKRKLTGDKLKVKTNPVAGGSNYNPQQ